MFVGTSGWQYDDWRGRFYPEDVPKRRWLEHYAGRFDVCESNNAFYRLPKKETFADWARRTPQGFRFTVKASRFLTHIKRLREPAEPVARFLKHAAGLGDKLAAVLLQLPPTLKADLPALEETLDGFGSRVPVAVEFRHDSWFTDDVLGVLEDRGAALCLADGEIGSDDVTPRRKSQPVTPLVRTAGWGYVRFHHGAATPDPCYGRGALASWAQRIADLYAQGEDVFAFFNNDTRGCAPANSRTFAAEARRAGLDVSRVPSEVIRTEDG